MQSVRTHCASCFCSTMIAPTAAPAHRVEENGHVTETVEQNGRVVQVNVDGVPQALPGSSAEPTQRIAYQQQHSTGAGSSNGSGSGSGGGTPTHTGHHKHNQNLNANAAAAAAAAAHSHGGARGRSPRQQPQQQVGPVEVAGVDVEMKSEL